MVNTEETGLVPGETSPLLGTDAGSNENSDSRDVWEGYRDFEHLPKWRRPSVYWLIGPYFLFTLAFGGVIVPKLNLIVDLVCRQYYADQAVLDPTVTFPSIVLGGDNPQCRKAGVQREVAEFTMVISVLTGVLSAITAPRLGSLSDRYGRTRLLTISSFGGVINEIAAILAAKFPDKIDYRWLILGAFFDGISGSFTAGNILGSSYTSDCSPPSKRGVYIGYLHACLFTGLAFGPLLSGYFVKWTGSNLSIFYVTLGCHIFFIFFILFITPESLSKRRQMNAREKHDYEQQKFAHSIGRHLPNSAVGAEGTKASSSMSETVAEWLPFLLRANPFEPLKVMAPRGQANAALRRNIIVLAFIDVVILSAAMGSGTVTILYVEYIFDWGTFESSRYVSLISFIRVIVLLGIFPIINYIFRIRPLRRQRRESGVYATEKNAGADELDVWMLRGALISDLIGIVGYTIVRSQQLFVVSGIITAFGGLGSAVIQSSMTKHTPPERVGALLGAIGLLHALGRVFAPMLFNGIYAFTVEVFPQAFFVVLASLFAMALIGSFFVRPHLYLKEDGYEPVPIVGSEQDFNALNEEEATAEADVVREALPRV
ncbi:major facilitator superfamily domain-containing protein [Xylariales sp. PMI_506]|nr:major facilitator superfamily domain-containing protein [Xylariales sp. PMI_506]